MKKLLEHLTSIRDYLHLQKAFILENNEIKEF